MNTTLPPSRDLPPHRHDEIRAAVLTSVGGRPAGRRLLAPLVTAAAALAVVGLVAYFVPWGQRDGVTSAGQPTETTAPPATPREPTAATGAPPVDGVTPDKATAIAEGCARSAGLTGEYTLRQLLVDEAGEFAVVSDDKIVMGCTLNDGTMNYNAGFGSIESSVLREPVSLDYAAASMGGDGSGNKPEYAGQHGFEVATGRVAPEVVKVTFSMGAETVDAKVANGSYVARIVHPTNWLIPENGLAPVVRAYDKNGTLLAEVGSQQR